MKLRITGLGPLNDEQIEALVADFDVIRPYRSDSLQPASYDLHLGYQLLVEAPEGADEPWTAVDLGRFTEARPYLLPPGAFVLAVTEERLILPPDICGYMVCRSSTCRTGLNHLNAGWVDPGFAGNLTLEFHNVLQRHCIPLWPGRSLTQLVLLRMQAAARSPYNGHYQGDSGVRPAWFQDRAPF